MKIKSLLIVLVVAVVGLGACRKGGGSDKSSEKDILKFSTGSDVWCDGNCGTTISYIFPKGTPEGTLTPSISLSDKADYTPKGTQNFFQGSGVEYTVTAEDGSTKKYIVKATVATTN